MIENKKYGKDTFSSPQRVSIAMFEAAFLLAAHFLLAVVFDLYSLPDIHPLWYPVVVIVVIFAAGLMPNLALFFIGVALGVALIGLLSLHVYDDVYSIPVSLIVLCFLGPIMLNLMAAPALVRGEKRKANEDVFGSAKWGSRSDMIKGGHLFRSLNKKPPTVALGRVAPDTALNRDPRFWHMGHILTCAPTGAGKGVGAVIPNLLDYEGSVFVLDIKGENYAVTSGYRREQLGHTIIKIDPFGVVPDGASARYNVLDWLHTYPDELIPDSEMVADMLVAEDTGKSGGESSHWEETAKDLLRGLIAYASLSSENSLAEVRRILTLPQEELETEVLTMQSSPYSVVARSASAFLAKADRERATVHSTALRHTQFLDDSRIEYALSNSTFNVADIKRTPMTVYLILPPEKVEAYKRFVRLFFGLFLTAITRIKEKPDAPVLFFLDEFAQLGRLRQIEDSISLVRGYGAFFWIFLQDLSQLKAVYPKWQTFLANSAKQFFAVSDYDTARYISEYMGERTVAYFTDNETEDAHAPLRSRKEGRSEALKGRRLMTPDEVMNTPETILLMRGELPYKVWKLNYYSDREYRSRPGLNPYESGKLHLR